MFAFKPATPVIFGPNITGEVSVYALLDNTIASQSFVEGAFYYNSRNITASGSYGKKTNGLSFSASRSNSSYGGASTVQPSAISCQYLIKY